MVLVQQIHFIYTYKIAGLNGASNSISVRPLGKVFTQAVAKDKVQ